MIWLLMLLVPIMLVVRKMFSKRPLPKSSLPAPHARLKNGEISGSWSYSSNEKRIFASFQGIPYAKPPVGKLRFMRPEPCEDWEGVKTCTRTVEFIQRNIFKRGNPRAGKEDALVLNVYSPNLKGDLPVMVFIHGGGYVSGSGSRAVYGAEHFMNKEVVLVTINYRLSVLGGLFLDGDKVPGNQGMRDQVLALRWIQDNIGSFGGDKSRVTIFGESAGAMSVMNHVVSPMSKGLFSAAIAQSGSPMSPFCCLNKHPADYGYRLVEHLGIDPKLPLDSIIDKLQAVDPLELQDLGYMFEQFVRAPLPFKPIVDGGLVEDPFLPEEPMELIKKGQYNKVPIIIGTNKDEGLLIKAFYLRQPKNFDIGWNNFDEIGPLAFFAKEKDEVTKEESAICREYIKTNFGETKFAATGKGSEKLVEMYGDLLFVAPADITARLMYKTMEEPIYMYSYVFQGTLSFYDVVAYPGWKILLRLLSLPFGFDLFKSGEGVCHADEMFLMFKTNAIPVKYNLANGEKKVQNDLLEMWTNFAAEHNPTPRSGDWKQFNTGSPEYYEIGRSCEMKYPKDYQRRMDQWRKIWEKIPPTHRNLTSPTWKNRSSNRYPID